MESFRLVLAGGDNQLSSKLLAAELHHRSKQEQEEVLLEAGIKCQLASADLGFELKTELGLTWNKWRVLKRYKMK